MKRIFLIIIFALLGISCMGSKIFNGGNDREKTVKELWRDYQDAVDADRPQKQLDILQEIKDKSKAQGLLWDFWISSQYYVTAATSRNWKVREEVNAARDAEIEGYGSPLLSFYFRLYNGQISQYDFVQSHKSELQGASHPEFWNSESRISSIKAGRLIPNYITDDYEYCLWAMALCTASRQDMESAREELTTLLEGKYPQAAILEYALAVRQDSNSRETYEKFASKYEGKAAALMAREELLWKDFYALEQSDKRTSDQYKELRARAGQFEKERKAFSGDEKKLADCCTRVENLIESLDNTYLTFSIEDGIAKIRVKNIPDVDLTIEKDKKSVFKKNIPNPIGSYYLEDSISFKLPDIDDGKYDVICKHSDRKSDLSYDKYTLSVATKLDSRGYGIYVADYKSGEPVTGVKISLLNGDSKAIATCENLSLKGFTYLPEAITSKIDKDSWRQTISVEKTDPSGRIRLSRQVNLRNALGYEGGDSSLKAEIFTDRSAFNPGETVQFKAILFRGNGQGQYSTIPEGEEVKARLTDPEGNEVKVIKLNTNEYGSVAGSFDLERAKRNGIFHIAILQGNNRLVSKDIRVDDFVLPTFELTFDQNDQLYFPGDQVALSGRILAYSGHSLGSAEVSYTVRAYGEIVDEGDIEPTNDGKFSVNFKSDENRDYCLYSVTIRVTDGTGETLEWTKGIIVNQSIPFYISLSNSVEASCSDFGRVINGDEASVLFDVRESSVTLKHETLNINYEVFFGDKSILSGKAQPGEQKAISLAGYPSGAYTIKAIATAIDSKGQKVENKQEFKVLKLKDEDTVLDASVENVFKVIEGDDIAIQIGATRGPVWAIVEIYGKGSVPLVSELIHLDGIQGKNGSLKTIRYAYDSKWSDKVLLKIMYFRNGSEYNYSRIYDRTDEVFTLPLSFTRFEDITAPGHTYSFQISTSPDVECVATIFDKSTETIMPNRWSRIYLSGMPAPNVGYSTATGINDGSHRIVLMKSAGKTAGAVMLDARANDVVEFEESAAMSDEMPVPEPALAVDNAVEEEAAEVSIREDFAGTVAFEPFLHSDKSGLVNLDFTATDKLSTYYVSVFAHNKSVQNSTIRREMKITIPVKVSIVEPQFLYVGDHYVIKTTVSSTMEKPVSGTLKFEIYPGNDYKNLPAFLETSKSVHLDAKGSQAIDLPLDIPSIDSLGIKVTFVPDDKSMGADAIFVSVPVYPGVQTITEAHSAILHSGESAEELIDSLRSSFINFDGAEASVKRTRLIDMVREAIPEFIDIKCKDAISLSDGLYACLLTERLQARERELFGSSKTQIDSIQSSETKILELLLKCLNDDGGYAWFEGMTSSGIITATILDRYASLIERGIALPAEIEKSIAKSVQFLDQVYFDKSDLPSWCGSISMYQYLYVRSMFANVPFKAKGTSLKGWVTFKKEAKTYLIPKNKRGLNAQIFSKARRTRTLQRLLSSSEGIALAKSWGIKLSATKRLSKSLSMDCQSLLEYAIPHKSGGIYYPNAVMPFRGLLESELYAHSLLCDLMRDASDIEGASDVAEGIRLWMMVQKETQEWKSDPACLESLISVLDGSAATLETEVVILKASGEKPFEAIKASGNGFTVERKYFIVRTDTDENGNKYEARVELIDDDALKVGDKVIAEYRIWNEENRSFVKLNAPRPACLRPVNQLSSNYGWWLSPLRISGWYTFSPQGYRNVLPNCTEYWFDTYPEEKTTISEEFFVTQEGRFKSPVVEIVCLYADHYRANDNGREPLTTTSK